MPDAEPPAGTVSPRELALVFLMLAPLAILFTAVAPIPQDPAFHALADRRALLNVPNFLNVASNVAFLIVGLIGLRLCLGRGADGASRSWAVFFFGTLAVAFGSSWYHWAPDNATLVWDRLPMTIAFMALFAALIAEHVRPAIERTLLRVALVVGIVSVGWWHYTDDLRLYIWVQSAPFIAIVYVLIAFPARYSHRGYLAWGLAFYALAKVAEFADEEIYSATAHVISGHTLKHLIAAVAPYCVYLMLRKRRALP
jgi:hypothetical protein